MISSILLIIITILLPPVGVALVAGCGADLLINILLTLLGYFPGHIHAFYIEYVYFKRRDQARAGIYDSAPAGGVYSDRVQHAGRGQGYEQAPDAVAPPQHNYGTAAPAPQGYGTVAQPPPQYK